MGVDNRRGVYICLEGLDGSGKTTVSNYLENRFKETSLKYCKLCPTKSLDDDHFIERLFRKSRFLNQSRAARAFLYAHRSNFASQAIDWRNMVILGDRSLITSYVVRWSQSALLNHLVVKMVNLMESKISAPDHVIYLDVPFEMLNERLNNRGKARDIDETEIRARQMKNAYFDLMKNKNIPRIAKVNWHLIPGDGEPETVGNRVFELVMEIIEKNQGRNNSGN